MTDEQINRRIAEACGWKDCGVVFAEENEIAYGLPPCRAQETDPDYYDETPDYCNDLNAMHEAEKILSNKLTSYGLRLFSATKESREEIPQAYIWHATARQRAEAFLRTLGKWEEAK